MLWSWATCGGMGLLMLSSAQALSQTVSLTPNGWDVGPINVKTQGGASFCSMKTSFENGYSLVIARDNNEAYSLALDFGAKQLTPGKQYDVMYKLGAIERPMLSIAATAQVLIAQMGKDGAFFEEMRDEGALDIVMDGNTSRFSLDGADQALTDLENCAEATNEGKAFFSEKKVSAAEAARMQERREELVNELTRSVDMRIGIQSIRSAMNEEIERLQEENRRLQLENQLAMARLKSGDQAAVMNEMQEVGELDRIKSALKIENRRLREMRRTAAASAAVQPAAGAAAKKSAKSVADKKEQPISAAALMPVHKSQAAAATTSGEDMMPVEAAPVEPVVAMPVTAVAAAAPVPAATVQAAPVPMPEGGKEKIAPVAPAPQAAEPVTYKVLPLVGSGVRAEKAGGMEIWRWQEANVWGAMQSWPLSDMNKLAAAAEDYVASLKSRCGGDFAARMAPVEMRADAHWMTAEIACFGTENSSAAGLVFVALAHKADIAIVTYESTPDGVTAALAQRQALVGGLESSYGKASAAPRAEILR